ncbi:MAG: preprotein translocase subunit SecG, partial [Clostridia bacterium]|nr:preprotein translocase subunit SecG [Clostridia bacterium]
MSAVEVILNILMVISALVMIVTVLMQSSDSDGMGALTGGSET